MKMDDIVGQQDAKTLYIQDQVKFMVEFNIWKGKRLESIHELRRIADVLAKLEKNVTITQTVGTATSLFGAFVAFVGIMTATFTFGASGVIGSVMGTGIGVVGGVVATGSAIYKMLAKNNNLKKTDAAITSDMKQLEVLCNLLMQLNNKCHHLTYIDEQDHMVYSFRKAYIQLCRNISPGSEANFTVSPMAKFRDPYIAPVSLSDAVEAGCSIVGTATFGQKAGRVGAKLATFVKKVASVAAVTKAATRSTVRISLKGILPPIGFIVDIGFLIYLARKLDMGSPSDVAKELRERANAFEQQLSKFDAFAKSFAEPPSYLERLHLNARRLISKLTLRDALLCFAALLFGIFILHAWFYSGPVTGIVFPRAAERANLELEMDHGVQVQSSFSWNLIHVTMSFVFTLGIAAVFFLS